MTNHSLNVSRRLSEREAAAYLGPVSVRTLQDWRTQKVGPPYSKLGKRVAYDVADLDAYIHAHRVEPKVGAANQPSFSNIREG